MRFLTSIICRKREYEAFCKERGLAPRAVPSHCETRFRMNIKLCQWMEDDDRGLYQFATKIKDDLESGVKKDITEAEKVILKDFLGDYIVVRLNNKFFLDVAAPVLKLINFFEAEEPMIFKRWERLCHLFQNYLGKFLKNAGGEDKTIQDLLKIDFKDRELQLDNADIYLGARVEAYLRELGLRRQSYEIQPWLESVRAYFVEALQKMVKYFKPSLVSKSLNCMDVLNPKTLFIYSLDELKKKYLYVAKSFSNIIKPHELPALLDEVAHLKILNRVKEATVELAPPEFFYELSKLGEKFKLISRLALALMTIYNSSSSAERDISKMNSILADPRTSSTKQLRLQTRLMIKSSVHNLKNKCDDCREVKIKKWRRQEAEDDKEDSVDTDEEEAEAKIKNEKSRHCHCKLFSVDEELMAEMNGGQPWKRYSEELKKKQMDKKEEQRLMEAMRTGDVERTKRDMKMELQRMRRRLKDQVGVKTKQVKFLLILQNNL
jgi:hypothetical protein